MKDYLTISENLQELYYRAIIVAKTQNNLSKQLAKISGIKHTTIEKYLIRFNFKQKDKALKMTKYMQNYMSSNCLFGVEVTI